MILARSSCMHASPYFCLHSCAHALMRSITFAGISITCGQDPLSRLLVWTLGTPAPQCSRCAPSRPNRQACACDRVFGNPGVGLWLWELPSCSLCFGSVEEWSLPLLRLRVRVSEVRVSPWAAPFSSIGWSSAHLAWCMPPGLIQLRPCAVSHSSLP
jgi:hypothetical protein